MNGIAEELNRFVNGTSAHAYRALGAHFEADGWRLRVFAPNAARVCATGDFCGWAEGVPMARGESGIWECLLKGAKHGDRYKFAVTSRSGSTVLKCDPFAFKSELRPNTASVLWHDEKAFGWSDGNYLSARDALCGQYPRRPMCIYEAHLGSWQRGLSFVDASVRLVRYCRDMGYTHIELMPLSEHPLDDSWGYQTSGYYSITARYGTPNELKLFIDRAHAEGIGVILDWVPAHFVKDDFGLRQFDGEALFESDEPLRAEMPLWGTLLFDFSKPHTRSFLLSNAVFFAEEFHVDGLRFDAVSCMLYHDFCKTAWLPDPTDGGNVNRSAVDFIRAANQTLHTLFPSLLTFAEESSAFPLVTRSVSAGGLGFDLKWNMGFMNDTLRYFELDSIDRAHHHSLLTFPMTFAFSEKYVLPFSHDEMVCGKRSLMQRMHGNQAAQFAQLRLLYCLQYAMPGKKLLFMGAEFGQYIEWAFAQSLDWFLLDYPAHAAVQDFVRSLNYFYRGHSALWRDDAAWSGFTWLAADDASSSVTAFLRCDPANGELLLCVCNFTPVERQSYRVPFGADCDITSVCCAFSTLGRVGEPIFPQRDEQGGLYADIPLYGYEGAYYTVTKPNTT